MSGTDRNETTNDVRRVLAALIELALVQDAGHAGDARARARAGLQALRMQADPTSLASVAFDGPWDGAKHDMEHLWSGAEALRASPALPSSCPLTLADLLSDDADADALAERLRLTAATG